MFKISKSDYVLGVKCPNALWFKKFRKDLQPEMNQAVLDRGTEVGILAQSKFPGGTTITAKPWSKWLPYIKPKMQFVTAPRIYMRQPLPPRPANIVRRISCAIIMTAPGIS